MIPASSLLIPFFHEAVQVLVNGLIRASHDASRLIKTEVKNRNGGDAKDASACVSPVQSAEHTHSHHRQ